MDFQYLKEQLRTIVGEYEDGERGAGRAMELVTAQFNALMAIPESWPVSVRQIKKAVDAWEEGDRPDFDVLATISALTRTL